MPLLLPEIRFTVIFDLGWLLIVLVFKLVSVGVTVDLTPPSLEVLILESLIVEVVGFEITFW